MNILFLTLSRITDITSRGIYTDLMREFIKHGHRVYIACSLERRIQEPKRVIESGGASILQVRTLNIQKTHIIEKGIGTLLLEYQFQHAIRKYWKDVNFDLVLYSTPPITFNRVIASIKRRCHAKSYLLLKDIFPQNAVDLGLFSANSLIYKFFRKKEERLYALSDYIGCMSPANVEYIVYHNKHVDTSKVEICPNSIEPIATVASNSEERKKFLSDLQVPTDKTLFVYGGNLGRPQGVDFLLEVIEENEKRSNSYIVVVGNGTEYDKMQTWFDVHKPINACLKSALPKEVYDKLVRYCDVGLIFLDRRFTIPNYPSRLLSYLENRMPILMATDLQTDIGLIAQKNGYGLWTESGNLDSFMEMVDKVADDKDYRCLMGNNGYRYLLDNYTVAHSYEVIMKHFVDR